MDIKENKKEKGAARVSGSEDMIKFLPAQKRGLEQIEESFVEHRWTDPTMSIPSTHHIHSQSLAGGSWKECRGFILSTGWGTSQRQYDWRITAFLNDGRVPS